MNKKNRLPFYILLLFAASFWGVSFIFTKILLVNFSPITIIFLRTLIASLFFLVICLIFFRKQLKINRKDIKLFFAFSFFEPFLYFIFETYSLQYSSASVVAIIIATIPLFTALLSKYYFKEEFSNLNIAGAVISIIGICIMLLPEFAAASFPVKGIVLAFCAVISATGYGFFLRKLPNTYHPVVIVTYQNIIGTALFFPLFLLLPPHENMAYIISYFTPQNISYLLILAVFCSALAFIFFVWGVQRLGLGKANIFSNLIPVITAIASFWLLKENFSLYKILGIVIVITGIFLVQKKR